METTNNPSHQTPILAGSEDSGAKVTTTTNSKYQDWVGGELEVVADGNLLSKWINDLSLSCREKEKKKTRGTGYVLPSWCWWIREPHEADSRLNCEELELFL
jgi:hypothetical protein